MSRKRKRSKPRSTKPTYRIVGADVRYSLDELYQATRSENTSAFDHSSGDRWNGYEPLSRWCERVGLDHAAAYRYKKDGLTAAVADRLAVAAGTHPALVWPSWIDDGLSMLEVMFPEGDRVAWLAMEEAS